MEATPATLVTPGAGGRGDPWPSRAATPSTRCTTSSRAPATATPPRHPRPRTSWGPRSRCQTKPSRPCPRARCPPSRPRPWSPRCTARTSPATAPWSRLVTTPAPALVRSAVRTKGINQSQPNLIRTRNKKENCNSSLIISISRCEGCVVILFVSVYLKNRLNR